MPKMGFKNVNDFTFLKPWKFLIEKKFLAYTETEDIK